MKFIEFFFTNWKRSSKPHTIHTNVQDMKYELLKFSAFKCSALGNTVRAMSQEEYKK